MTPADAAARTADLFSVEGKIILVAGGSSGVGSMIAAGFVDAGASVTICGRDRAALKARAAELSERGHCESLPGDVSTESGCEAIAASLGAVTPRVDVLVNSAGSTSMAPLEDFDEQAWEHVLAVNLKGVAHLTRFLLPLLQAAATAGNPARVVNIGSIAGERVGQMDNYAYTSSKAALHHLTRHLARRLAPMVTVNALAPGPFESRMTAAVLATHRDAIVAASPLERIGTPDDIAAAAIYLSSRAGAWVTGTVLTVDGGLSLT